MHITREYDKIIDRDVALVIDFYFNTNAKYNDILGNGEIIIESIRFYIDMAKGYMEMGNINLQLAEEHTHHSDIYLENEGVNGYEMEEKESKI